MSNAFKPFTDEDWDDFSGAVRFDDQSFDVEPVVARGDMVAAVIDRNSIQVVNRSAEEEFRIELPVSVMRFIRDAVLKSE